MSFGQRTPKRNVLAASLVLLFACSSFAAPAEQTEAIEAENTKMNQRDADGKTLTADDQARGSAQDVELTRKVRQEFVNDKSLSTDARNVKIITLNGIVTLRGPVESSAEKAKLNSLTKKVSGVKKVDNQTDVKTKTY